MLSRIEISDFALIEYIEIDFQGGLTILTGETGAGKSIIIDSIGALLGNRISKEMIREGCDLSVITGYFTVNGIPEIALLLRENDIPANTDLTITREIYSSGRTLARINQRNVSLALLKEIAVFLMDIHGQHENQTIFSQDTQLTLLDRFAGEPVKALLDQYREILAEYNDCIDQMAGYLTDDEKKYQLIELLEYQMNEIRLVHPKPGEDEELKARRAVLSNAMKIQATLEKVYEYLNGTEFQLPALAAISESRNLASTQLGAFSDFGQLQEDLADAEFKVEAICDSVKAQLDQIEQFPGESEKIDERLDLLFRLKSKYGGSIEAVIKFYRDTDLKLKDIRASEQHIEMLKRKKDALSTKLLDYLDRLYAQRSQAALVLEETVSAELDGLGMKGTTFCVRMEKPHSPEHFPNTGIDRIGFFISPNTGEGMKPLSLIASGGEASRIMIAIKTILANSDRIPSLVFDEVDTGISGKTAGLLGDKLLELSENHQIFCVTHMAQIASKATDHIYIEKAVHDQRTTVSVSHITGDARAAEIARLLSGEQNRTKAMELAREMLGMNSLNQIL